jgi:hypothetical protein
MKVGTIKVPIRGREFIEREAQRLLDEYVGETGAAVDGPVPVEGNRPVPPVPEA